MTLSCRQFLLSALLLISPACDRQQDVGPGHSSLSAVAPTRIVPTNATAVDFVFDLAGAERIVAIPDTVADYATVEIDSTHWSGERVFSDFSAEVLLGMDPDLVVVSPWQDQSTIDRLREAGIEVLELPPVLELKDIEVSLTIVGEAVHEVEKASLLVADFRERLELLRMAREGRGGLTGLVYTNYGSGGWAAGSGTTAHQMLVLAGISNAAATAGRSGHDGVDIETLLFLDPDVLVISKPSRDYGVTRAYLEGEESLAGLDAIRTGRLLELPSDLFSTASHHLLDAAELLSRQVDALFESGQLPRRE